jgi:hypothetical protein
MFGIPALEALKLDKILNKKEYDEEASMNKNIKEASDMLKEHGDFLANIQKMKDE